MSYYYLNIWCENLDDPRDSAYYTFHCKDKPEMLNILLDHGSMDFDAHPLVKGVTIPLPNLTFDLYIALYEKTRMNQLGWPEVTYTKTTDKSTQMIMDEKDAEIKKLKKEIEALKALL